MNYAALIFSDPLITWSFFIAVFAFLGLGIKYVDDAFDERVYSRKNALLVAPVLAIIWAAVMSLSAASATILGAIVIAVLLKGKIDTIAFKIAVIVIFAILVVFGWVQFLWFPLLVIAVAGILDEVGNDTIDRLGKQKTRNPIIYYFFRYRFLMKIAVLYFALIGAYDLLYFFAFLAFDIAYALLYNYDLKLKESWKTVPTNNFNSDWGKIVL